MRGKLADKQKRTAALKRMEPQLRHYKNLILMLKIGRPLPDTFKIKTKGIKKNMTPSELLDLKIKRITECIDNTKANNTNISYAESRDEEMPGTRPPD